MAVELWLATGSEDKPDCRVARAIRACGAWSVRAQHCQLPPGARPRSLTPRYRYRSRSGWIRWLSLEEPGVGVVEDAVADAQTMKTSLLCRRNLI